MDNDLDRVDGRAAPALSAWDAWLGRIETAFNLGAALCIFALMLLGMVQVLGRQLFNKPVSGYIDLVELSMATFAFLGVAYCQRLGGHVRMEMILKMLRGRAYWAMEVFGTVAGIFIIAVLTWYGYEHFLRAYELGDSTIDADLPVWPSKLLVPLSFAVLLLRLLIQLVGYGRMLLHPELRPVAVPAILSVEQQAAKEIQDSLSSSGRARTD
jgi:C4-dicarboxylate transporter DctQ subunit